MFQGLKKLYDNELYANVLPIGSIIITMYNNDRSSLTPEQYFLSLMYYGISLYEERQFRRAENMFRNAMQAKNAVLKIKSSFGSVYDVGLDPFPDADIRYRRAQCLEATQEIPEAANLLQAIPLKQRTAKMNMLLAKLLQHTNNDKSALQPLKAVLKECPLNMEAIKGLLALGVKPAEINSLIAEAGLPAQCTDWLSNYIVAYSHIYSGRFTEAIESLQAIESKPGIGDNEGILVLIGKCYHYIGNHDTALYYLMRAHNNNQYLTDGLMTLASLYAIKNRLDDLEKLTMPAVGPSEYSAKYWFVLAQHLFSQGKHERAAFFAEKTCHMRPKNAEATLLKVKSFMHMKRYKEAVSFLRALQQFAPYRFEVYEGLVEAYLAMNRIRDAADISRDGVKRMGPNISARSLVLLARPYFAHSTQQMKAKSVLERALAKEEYYLPAVLLMVPLLQQENKTAAAIQMIKKQLAMQPNSKLYSLLGDIVSAEKDRAKAVKYYTIAINMDPTNRKAVAGLIAMGQSSSKTAVKGESSQSGAAAAAAAAASSYQNATSTDEEGVLFGTVVSIAGEAPENESDSEAMWSDLDIDEQIGNS